MAEYRAVCRVDELPPGTGQRVEVDGREIAVFNVDGTVYAVEDVCLHAGGPLHEGEVQGTEIVCPWHQWRFDLRTGACVLHRVALGTYATRIRDGVIEVAV